MCVFPFDPLPFRDLNIPPAQSLAKANINRSDGIPICSYLDHCDEPAMKTVKAKFPKPAPKNPKIPAKQREEDQGAASVGPPS
jgi:hypothetical protein